MANARESLNSRSERVSGVHRIGYPSEMLVMALHDLRSPLWTMKLGLEQLRQSDAMPADQRRYAIGRLSRSVDRMSELLAGLMTALELHEGDLPLCLTWVDLSEVVEEVVHSLSPRAERLGRTIAMTSVPPVRGRWDSLRLWQITHNLLCNALQYGRSAVRVHVWQQAGQCHLAVEDDGPGLEPWEQARVFDRYWRGTEASRTADGHGLGLWIVRRLVQALGGDVHVESAPGSGTRFVVRLPAESAT